MSYITKTTKLVKQEVLECSLPGVTKIWATGSMSGSGVPKEAFYTINILFENGNREDFSDKDPDKAWISAEEWCEKYSETHQQPNQ